MRITESQLRRIIKGELLREFQRSGVDLGAGVPLPEPAERGSSNVVRFSAYMTQGGGVVTTSLGSFDYDVVMGMSKGEAFEFFNELRAIKLFIDFSRERLVVPLPEGAPQAREDFIVKRLTSVPFGSQTSKPPYVLKYEELEPKIRADFRAYDACVSTAMWSMGSTIFASCPNSDLVSPGALEALAQHVAGR